MASTYMCHPCKVKFIDVSGVINHARVKHSDMTLSICVRHAEDNKYKTLHFNIMPDEIDDNAELRIESNKLVMRKKHNLTV